MTRCPKMDTRAVGLREYPKKGVSIDERGGNKTLRVQADASA